MTPESCGRSTRKLPPASALKQTLDVRLRTGEIEEEMVPRELWMRLGTATERLGEAVARSEEMATELAVESRRLRTAVEAGEITQEEAEQMLWTHMEALSVRLRSLDKPR